MLRSAWGFPQWVLSMEEGRADSAGARGGRIGQADRASFCRQQRALRQPPREASAMPGWNRLWAESGGATDARKTAGGQSEKGIPAPHNLARADRWGQADQGFGVQWAGSN